MSDNRRHPRVAIRQRVWCEGDDLTLYVQALNASERGLFVRTASPAAAGEKLRVTFPDLEGEVVAQAEVVWTRPATVNAPGGMGMRIVHFEKGLEGFNRFLARKLGGGAAPDDDDEEEPDADG